MEVSSQLHSPVALLPKKYSLEPIGSEAVRLFRRRESEIYSHGGGDGDRKDGENCVMNIIICVRRQTIRTTK
jgi:hypothetical protein